MEPLVLRPLSIGEILDVGIKIVIRNAWTLVRIVFLIVAPVQILGAIVEGSALPDSYWDVQTGDEFTTVEDEDIWAGLGAILLTTILGLIATTLAVGACFKAIADAYLGETPGVRSSLRFAFGKLHSLLWLTFLYYLIAGFGLLFCVIPGVFLLVAWIVAIPALMTEDLRGRHALGRSYRLVQGRWWPTLGLSVIGLLIAAFIEGVIQTIFSLTLLSDAGDSVLFLLTIGAIATTLGALVSTPLVAAFRTVLYFDLRVRKEGFDLELLAERVGVAPDPERQSIAPQEPASPWELRARENAQGETGTPESPEPPPESRPPGSTEI